MMDKIKNKFTTRKKQWWLLLFGVLMSATLLGCSNLPNTEVGGNPTQKPTFTAAPTETPVPTPTEAPAIGDG